MDTKTMSEAIQENTKAIVELKVNVVDMKEDVSTLVIKFDDLPDMLDKHYVRREEFNPVIKVVYGAVGLICIGVVGALVSLILK